MSTNIKRKAILDRAKALELDINKAQEYLETGANADWRGFRPYFKQKIREGKALPPHRGWVKNVFLPNRERALGKAEKLLDKFE